MVKEASPQQLHRNANLVFRAKASSKLNSWRDYIRSVCDKVGNLRKHSRVTATERGSFDTWHNQAVEHLSEDKYKCKSVLVQYGLRELLYFLYRCLKELLDKGNSEKATQVLVREALVHFRYAFRASAHLFLVVFLVQKEWVPEEIVQRTVRVGLFFFCLSVIKPLFC